MNTLCRRHWSMRRSALLGAAVVALGGLVGAPAARAATPPLVRPPAQAFGLGQRYVSVGRHTKQGQAMQAYRFKQSAGSVPWLCTLWIARVTALPVEKDIINAVALRPGVLSLVIRTTQRWSRWNDFRLTITSVPAS